MTFYIESLGCARNQVDSEILAGHLVRGGLFQAEAPEKAEVILVNTCSFVQDAADESIDMILELAGYKKTGLCRFLVVAGCLPERFQEDIVSSFPEVDLFAGTGAYFSILSFLEKEAFPPNKTERLLCPLPETALLHTSDMARIRSDAPGAYLKVAEGCSRHCTYCIIPKLRGRQRSRILRDLAAEAKRLELEGVRELNLVAQETTDWGRDLQTGEGIADLVRSLCDSLPHMWIRILYGHPLTVSDDLLELMAERPNFCSYLDIPVQHASDDVLRRMGRGYGRKDLLALFKRIREKVGDIALRTTLITGFPGETEEDFLELVDFIKEVSFDHLGVFVYSDMEDLPSHHLKNHVAPETAARRRDVLMEVQAEISFGKNQKKIGKVFPVLIEKPGENGVAEGRAMFQAPEVDGLVYVDGANLLPGTCVWVEITDAFDYDLAGEVADS